MVKVTESARGLLKDVLASHSDNPEMSIRLIENPEKAHGLGLTLDKHEQEDQVIEHEGTKVLLIAPELAPKVEEVTLDVQNTTDGPKLAVNRG